MNQIIICQNTAKSSDFVQRILTHEMIHMFDYCSNYLDFNNLEHLACTEIRAANLAHCSFLDAYAQTSGVFNVKQRHMVNYSQISLGRFTARTFFIQESIVLPLVRIVLNRKHCRQCWLYGMISPAEMLKL